METYTAEQRRQSDERVERERETSLLKYQRKSHINSTKKVRTQSVGDKQDGKQVKILDGKNTWKNLEAELQADFSQLPELVNSYDNKPKYSPKLLEKSLLKIPSLKLDATLCMAKGEKKKVALLKPGVSQQAELVNIRNSNPKNSPNILDKSLPIIPSSKLDFSNVERGKKKKKAVVKPGFNQPSEFVNSPTNESKNSPSIPDESLPIMPSSKLYLSKIEREKRKKGVLKPGVSQPSELVKICNSKPKNSPSMLDKSLPIIPFSKYDLFDVERENEKKEVVLKPGFSQQSELLNSFNGKPKSSPIILDKTLPIIPSSKLDLSNVEGRKKKRKEAVLKTGSSQPSELVNNRNSKPKNSPYILVKSLPITPSSKLDLSNIEGMKKKEAMLTPVFSQPLEIVNSLNCKPNIVPNILDKSLPMIPSSKLEPLKVEKKIKAKEAVSKPVLSHLSESLNKHRSKQSSKKSTMECLKAVKSIPVVPSSIFDAPLSNAKVGQNKKSPKGFKIATAKSFYGKSSPHHEPCKSPKEGQNQVECQLDVATSNNDPLKSKGFSSCNDQGNVCPKNALPSPSVLSQMDEILADRHQSRPLKHMKEHSRHNEEKVNSTEDVTTGISKIDGKVQSQKAGNDVVRTSVRKVKLSNLKLSLKNKQTKSFEYIGVDPLGQQEPKVRSSRKSGASLLNPVSVDLTAELFGSDSEGSASLPSIPVSPASFRRFSSDSKWSITDNTSDYDDDCFIVEDVKQKGSSLASFHKSCTVEYSSDEGKANSNISFESALNNLVMPAKPKTTKKVKKAAAETQSPDTTDYPIIILEKPPSFNLVRTVSNLTIKKSFLSEALMHSCQSVEKKTESSANQCTDQAAATQPPQVHTPIGPYTDQAAATQPLQVHTPIGPYISLSTTSKKKNVPTKKRVVPLKEKSHIVKDSFKKNVSTPIQQKKVSSSGSNYGIIKKKEPPPLTSE